MTDSLAALSLLADTDGPARDQALADFHARWRGDDLVLDKWFSIQAMSSRAGCDGRGTGALRPSGFRPEQPEPRAVADRRLRQRQPAAFPRPAGGEGYRFLADAVIALDPINAAIAARLVSPLGRGGGSARPARR